MVRKASDDFTDMQQFIPDGSTNHATANALKNAADNNKLVKNLDDEKLLTKNIDNGAERVVVIEKGGDVYSNPHINNIDQLDDDVLKAADPSDIADAADDVAVFQEMRDYKQNFINGKRFENNVLNNANTKGNVFSKTALNAGDYNQTLRQVQLKTSTGDYFVADEVYVRFNSGTGKYDVVINEVKISGSTAFTTRQNQFLADLRNGTVDFELRSTKFGPPSLDNIPQGVTFNVKAVVKSAGDGTVNGTPTFTKFDPVSNTWN
ncbi:MAG: hypothetical protein DI535_00170 [Citrobacter freundii]|nr:MAG: hypothetical protein DI535_00170 [Citrobacter freundii]